MRGEDLTAGANSFELARPTAQCRVKIPIDLIGETLSKGLPRGAREAGDTRFKLAAESYGHLKIGILGALGAWLETVQPPTPPRFHPQALRLNVRWGPDTRPLNLVGVPPGLGHPTGAFWGTPQGSMDGSLF